MHGQNTCGGQGTEVLSAGFGKPYEKAPYPAESVLLRNEVRAAATIVNLENR